MENSFSPYPEEEFKRLLNRIARICVSDEFQALRKELESLYKKIGNESPFVNAYQDALYAILAQNDDCLTKRPQVNPE